MTGLTRACGPDKCGADCYDAPFEVDGSDSVLGDSRLQSVLGDVESRGTGEVEGLRFEGGGENGGDGHCRVRY